MAKKDKNQKQIEEKMTELENQLKRALADYQNLERRVSEGRSELTKLGIGDFILRIVPSLNHLEQALEGAREAGEEGSWLQGVEMAVKEFKKVLEQEGLIPVQTETFDPNLHEAVEVVEGEDGKIIKVLQMGYNLNGKTVQPAKVVVGKKESRIESQESRKKNIHLTLVTSD